MRIAFGGFHLEASTYNPGRSRTEDFRIFRGPDLIAAPAFRFLAALEADFVPIFHARAVPGAPMDAETYGAFKGEFLDGLKARLPVDGVYLALHGAANVAGMDDAEGDFITETRRLVGPDVPIAVSYDLHGNVSQKIIDAIDIFTAYRTAPHIDVEETQRRAVTMLMRAISTGIRPSVCWAPIPVVMPGERSVTTAEPNRSLYGRLGEIEAANPGIWDAALMVGFVWADEPRVTAAAIMTGTDTKAMEREALDLAQAYWDARARFDFSTATAPIKESVGMALASASRPVFLSDSGDNVTAGGAGDRADMLRALRDAGATDTIVAGITDRAATDAAYAAGPGSTLDLDIGASLDPQGSSPIAISAQVVRLLDTDADKDREAVLSVGGITLVVTARRKAFTVIEDFERLGLDPAGARIVVVKLGYLFPELAPLANPAIMVLSEGIVDQAVERLPRHRAAGPLYPMQTEFAYAPRAFWSARGAV